MTSVTTEQNMEKDKKIAELEAKICEKDLLIQQLQNVIRNNEKRYYALESKSYETQCENIERERNERFIHESQPKDERDVDIIASMFNIQQFIAQNSSNLSCWADTESDEEIEEKQHW